MQCGKSGWNLCWSYNVLFSMAWGGLGIGAADAVDSYLMPKPNLPSNNQWDRIAQAPEFSRLLAAKRRFILPSTLFFLIYYISLPVLVGFAPELMKRRVWGPLNIAYLFALSQFFMTWILAGFYLRAAGRFDRMSAGILNDAGVR